MSYGNLAGSEVGKSDVAGGKKEREPQVLDRLGLWTPDPDASIGSSPWSQNSTASAYVRWDGHKDRKRPHFRQEQTVIPPERTQDIQNGFNTTSSTIAIMISVGISLITR
jgi:hypothetical protein